MRAHRSVLALRKSVRSVPVILARAAADDSRVRGHVAIDVGIARVDQLAVRGDVAVLLAFRPVRTRTAGRFGGSARIITVDNDILIR